MRWVRSIITESYIALVAFVGALVMIEVSLLSGPNSVHFMPRMMCWMADPRVMTLHIASDSIIALAYFGMPIYLALLARKQKGSSSNLISLCFAGFIMLCGATHVMSIVVVWKPLYWVDGWLKAATAFFSLTVLFLFRAFVRRSPSTDEVERIKESHARLKARIERVKTAHPHLREWAEEEQAVNDLEAASQLLKNYANLKAALSGQAEAIPEDE